MSKATDQYVLQNEARFLEELKEFLRIPSVSTLPEHAKDTHRAAAFVAAKLKDAVKAYESRSNAYPEGTIIRMIPGEAMVKRAAGTFPQSNGWEYLSLAVTPQGTTVRARGYEASNGLGTCQSCHSAAKADYVCASGGCAAVPLTEERIAQIQAADPRCAKQ